MRFPITTVQVINELINELNTRKAWSQHDMQPVGARNVILFFRSRPLQEQVESNPAHNVLTLSCTLSPPSSLMILLAKRTTFFQLTEAPSLRRF